MTTSNKTTIATQGPHDAITMQRQMADELCYARQGTYSPDYLKGDREAMLAAYFARNPDALAGHTEALAAMWAAANELDQGESHINQDEANAATRKDVKQWLADSGYAVKNAAMGQYTKAAGERVLFVTAAKSQITALLLESSKLGSAALNPNAPDFHAALIPAADGALQPAMGYAARLEAIKWFVEGREGEGMAGKQENIPFHKLTFDQQIARMAADKAAVPEESMNQVFANWSQATKDYMHAGYQVASSFIAGKGNFSYIDGRLEVVSKCGISKATQAQNTEVEDAIRGGQLQICVYPRWWSERSDNSQILQIYAATGKFHEFEYRFRLPGSDEDLSSPGDNEGTPSSMTSPQP
jgi:hypothetical protein